MLTTLQITEIYVQVDDYCKFFDKNIDQCIKKLPTPSKRRYYRAPSLSNSEVITILICFHLSDYRTLKHFYLDHVCTNLTSEFPKTVSYNRFVELQKDCGLHLMMFLTQCCMGKCTGISFIDSTKLAVCMNQRIHQHKVFLQIAQRGKTTTGWFFGFKLHFVINDCGEILSFKITTANTADNNENVLLTLCKKVFGKLYGDKGYIINQSVFEKLFFEGVHLVTKVRKNMKNKLMTVKDKINLRKRALIETIIDQFKNICQIEHSRHRSVSNFITNLFAGLSAYGFTPKKPSIKSQFQFDDVQSTQLSL